MTDIFQPRTEPAKSIYAAFQAEASFRDSRSIEEWQAAEVKAVFREAIIQAQILGLAEPTIGDIQRAERCAFGSIDYGSKWAVNVANAMRKSS